MAEVTRVPLQPIAKGSLTKLWLGIVVAVLLAAGVAWAAVPQGVTVDEIAPGAGDSPGAEDVVWIRYTGRLQDGTVFDQSQDLALPVEGILPEGTPMPLEGVVPGFREALMQTQRGGRYEIFIPAEKAYGEDVPAGGPIPPNSDLTFEVEVIDFMGRAEAEQRVNQLQQMMMQQMDATGEGGAGGSAAPMPMPMPAPAPAQ